jgi:hypothetical protein
VTGSMDDPKILPTLKKQCDGVVEEFKQEISEFINK